VCIAQEKRLADGEGGLGVSRAGSDPTGRRAEEESFGAFESSPAGIRFRRRRGVPGRRALEIAGIAGAGRTLLVLLSGADRH